MSPRIRFIILLIAAVVAIFPLILTVSRDEFELSWNTLIDRPVLLSAVTFLALAMHARRAYRKMLKQQASNSAAA